MVEVKQDAGKGARISLFVVVGALVLGTATLLWYWGNWPVRIALGLVGVYELWTLANKYPYDTLSETIRRLARWSPLIPMVFTAPVVYWYYSFGVRLATGGMTQRDIMSELGLMLVTLLHYGHWFYPLSEARK